MPSFNDLTPQEIVAAPLRLFYAPLGTAVPDVSKTDTVVPDYGWLPVGTSLDLDYDPAGLTVTHNGTYTTWTPVGSTLPNKVWRTAEELTISVTLADTSPTQYALALNNNSITNTSAASGIAGQSAVELQQGLQVTVFALLARGTSSISSTYQAQYWVPCVYQSAAPAPVYRLGAPAELALTFTALNDPSGNGFGKYIVQSAAPTA